MKKAAQVLSAGGAFIDYGIRLDYRRGFHAAGADAVGSGFRVGAGAPRREAGRFPSPQSRAGRNRSHRRLAKEALGGRTSAGQRRTFQYRQQFLASLRHALAVRPGLDPQKKLFVMTVRPGRHMAAAAWCEQASERLASVAGVRGATFARRLPLSGSGRKHDCPRRDSGQAPLGALLNNVGGNYFALMGTRVLAGRAVDTNDRAASSLVAVVSQTFAQQVFPGRNPIGEWLKINGKAAASGRRRGRWPIQRSARKPAAVCVDAVQSGSFRRHYPDD